MYGVPKHVSGCMACVCMCQNVWRACACVRMYGVSVHVSECMACLCMCQNVWRVCACVRMYGVCVHVSECMACLCMCQNVWRVCACVRMYGGVVIYRFSFNNTRSKRSSSFNTILILLTMHSLVHKINFI